MADGHDVIVLGAGAAGLMCAARAGQRGLRVLLLEGCDQPGKKILISGGGRCNFTNVHTAPDRYLSANPHFAKSALARYTPRDFIQLVEAHGIAWHEKTLGQLFCDGSARQIVDMLLAECAKGNVELRCDAAIRAVRHADGAFTVETVGGEVSAPKLVLATGGPSIPKMGATSFAYDLARQFRLKVVQPRPALVPLTLGGDDVLFRELSGVATEVVASAGKARFREAALFTHRGLSGPAILQASSYWQPGDTVMIDFLPECTPDRFIEAKAENPRATIRSVLSAELPDRLAVALADRIGEPKTFADTKDKALRMAGERLKRWIFHPNGTEGFAKAEVTVGGIATADLSSKTLEAKTVPGLHVIGEAVDVTGWLGGYNFQWAWASAVACAASL
ncbi:NAD(P)/FAD-dependent oxidoreductase [Croceicoccus ponticola]|uniref:NAD(P)/FAD-dependent oxidoreductase n=1 Tax=Croceicoccus ponticola TaxID=2217664 RepID=A0A437GXJ4_9SPHN|nr:NAD(P)/FAD-dependent oxidoreductase [Croceicoccus ponticola]RVQ67128.1 NAD(P)/FAD-dependent oxidoreductase [Croceicoccus ponticola]